MNCPLASLKVYYISLAVGNLTRYFFLILRAIGTGDSKGPLIFLRGISYHEIEAVLEFMYNGQTKVQQTELDAFLAAAEELKIKGLTTSNPTGNTNDSTPTSRKRPSTHVQHEDSPFDNNGAGLQKSSKSKKSRPAPNAVGQAGPSSAHSTLFDYLILQENGIRAAQTFSDI